MLVSKPFLKRSRARLLPGPPLITLRVNNGTGDSSMVHEWARLVHEWARLAQVSSCGRGVPSVF